MTTNHIFFIPLVLLVGIVIGVVLGRRSVSAELAEQERLAARRRRRRASAGLTREGGDSEVAGD